MKKTPKPIEQLVRQIHEAGTRWVIACAGGGSRAVAHLLDVPGASRSVLAAVVPYCEAALTKWLGGKPDQSCAATTARAMAMAAFCQARAYDDTYSEPVRISVSTESVLASKGTVPFSLTRKSGQSPHSKLAGLGCTASLATDRPKRGPHRVHLAVQTVEATVTWSLELTKGRRSRGEEEQVVSCLLVNLIAATCGLPGRLAVELLQGERVGESKVVAPEAWRELLLGRVAAVCLGNSPQAGEEDQVASSRRAAACATPQPGATGPAARLAIFPGAFHPLHAGHRRMAELARQRLGVPVQFEISVFNVDKPPLDYYEIDTRARQFAADQPLWLTQAPTFLEKSRQFPGATFVVGADTLRRIADPRYYGGAAAACRQAIEEMAGLGCRFLVFGRVAGERFATLADLDLPDSLRAICQEVPANVFRDDTSSTELRRQEGTSDER